jgi:hypothetical protein
MVYNCGELTGTAGGTVLVKSPGEPVPQLALPPNITVVNGSLYFQTGNQLWKTDGTTAGTVMVENNVDPRLPIASLAGQLVRPTVTSVTASPQTGALGVGHEIALTVGFSEAVTFPGIQRCC